MMTAEAAEMDVLSEAIQTFGKENQCRMAIEEMSELTKEICKNLRGSDNVGFIAEEIADVRIMLDQLEKIFECTEMTNDWKIVKLARLKKLLRGGVKNG